MRRLLPVGWAAVIVASSVVLAATAAWMSAASKYEPAPILPDGVREPVLALELARSPREVAEILRVPESQGNRTVLRGQIGKDWIFIVAYASFFAALAASQRRNFDPVRRGLGWGIALGILVTATLDVLENRGMLGILDAKWLDVGAERVAEVRIWSLGKWLALFATCLLAGLLLLDWRRRPGAPARLVGTIAKVAGALFLASGLIGLRGLASPGFITTAMLVLSAAILLTASLAASVFVPWRGHQLREQVLIGLASPASSRAASGRR